MIILAKSLFVRRVVALAVLAAVGCTGCVSYTSNYRPDPRTRKTVVGIDRDASQAGPMGLSVTGAPTAASPSGPLTLRLSRTLTGPQANITSVRENRYKRHWSPLTIPFGALFTAVSPIIISAAALSPDDKVLGKILGVDDPDPCKHGMFMFSLMSLVGIIDSCDIVDGRDAQEKDPTGKTVSEVAGVPKVPLAVTMSAKGEAPVVRTVETDGNGSASIALAPHFRTFGAEPGEVEIVVRASGEGQKLEQSVRIGADAARRIFLPVAEERAGDRALAEGKGLAALEHFTRACENAIDPAGQEALRRKAFDTYRTLAVKPPVPEETRRLLVQAEAMARDNDPDRAIAMLSEAARRTPWLPVARYNLAMAHSMKYDYDAAIASMGAYLELAPDAPDARKARDLVYEWEAARDKAKGGAGTQGGKIGSPAGRGRR